jgi:hypothetical protein
MALALAFPVALADFLAVPPAPAFARSILANAPAATDPLLAHAFAFLAIGLGASVNALVHVYFFYNLTTTPEKEDGEDWSKNHFTFHYGSPFS